MSQEAKAPLLTRAETKVARYQSLTAAPAKTAPKRKGIRRTRTALLLFSDQEDKQGLNHADSDDDDDDTPKTCWDRVQKFFDSRFIRSLRNPTGFNRRMWNLMMLCFIMYNVITIPLRMAFHEFYEEEENQSSIAVFLFFDYVGDLIFWLDIILLFFTPFNEEGFFVTDPKVIVRNYLRTWFFLDLISSLPLDFISFVVWKHALLRVQRVFRLAKFDSFFKVWEQFANHSGFAHAMRFLKLMLGLFCVVHWWACIYLCIGSIRGFGTTTWLPEEEIEHESMGTQYLYALFWSTNYNLGVGGEPEKPTDNFERVVALFICLFAIFIVAIIIGNVAELIAQLNAGDEEFRKKMDDLNLFMRNRRLPEDLKSRIRTYYRNIWSRHGGLDDKSILGELPVSLRNEVSLVMNEDLIQKVPLFQQSSQAFIHNLIQYLEPQIYSPFDMIVKVGDIGNEMYFIRRGKVDVVIANGEVVSQLKEGDYFGEIALLEDNCKRTASIRAYGFCDLFVLTRENLESVLKSFPEQRAIIRDIADSRKAKDLLRASLQKDPLFTRAGDDFIKRMTVLFERCVLTDEDGPVEYLCRNGESANAVYFLGRGQIELSAGQRGDRSSSPPPLPASSAAAAAAAAEGLGLADGKTPAKKSAAPAAASTEDDEGEAAAFCVLTQGNFFGEISNEGSYAVNAKLVGDVQSTIVFRLTAAALEKLHTEFEGETYTTNEFVKRFRAERDYRKHATNAKWAEDKKDAHAAKVAHVPLGFLSAQKIISRAKRPAGAVGGHGAPPSASKHDATAIVAGGAPSQFNIKSAWLHKLGGLNMVASDKDIETLSNEELLIAHECLSIMQEKLSLQLFRKLQGDASDEGHGGGHGGGGGGHGHGGGH